MIGAVRPLHYLSGVILLLCFSRIGLAARYGGNMQGRCSLLDQTIFCYGGYTEISTDTATNAFFGLNISQPITKISAETSWVDLTKPSNNVVLEANANFAMTSVPQRGLLFVSGGDGYNHTDLDRQVSIYFASNNTWVNVAVPQSDFEQMFDETAVADAQGNNVYLWGGETVFQNTSGYFSYPKEIRAFSFVTGMWSRLSPPGDDILPRVFHTAVLGKDNRSIYIFGGLEINQLTNETSNRDYYALSYASFAEIPSYDTVNNSWNLTRVTGDIVPSARYLHTTSVVGSGEIVLYGGIYVSLNFSDINSTHSSLDYFYIFDTDRMAWRNTTLNTTHDAGPGPIHAHSAVYAGNDTLFILFGVSPRSFISGFSILDTKQWAWTTTFGGIHPTPVSNATSSPTASVGDVSGGSDGGGLSPGGIAGVVVGVIAGVAIIGVAGFFLLRARRKPAADIVDPQAPMSHSKMSDSLTSPPLSPTLQQHSSQGRTSFTLENQPTSRNSAYVAGKPDVHYSNANNADNTYVPHLRLEPVKPEE